MGDKVRLASNTVQWKLATRGPDLSSEYVREPGGREKPLYKDPYMEYFRVEIGEDPLPKIMQPPLSVRHRFFNRAISEEVKRSEVDSEPAVKQVIILGSGFDTRPVRKRKYTTNYGVSFFECDHADVLQHKKSVFAAHETALNSTMLAVDYIEEDIIAALKAQGCDCEQPTFVLLEGNTMYIDKEKLKALFVTLKENFPHLVIAFDYMHEGFVKEKQAAAAAEEAKRGFKAQKVAWVTGYVDAQQVADEVGLTVAADRVVADLEREYRVENNPFETAWQYSVCVLRS